MGLGNLQLFAQCHHVLGPCNYLITAYLYTETQKTQSHSLIIFLVPSHPSAPFVPVASP
ncbi:hypothetical protein FOXYSP1_16003 [Fusarium oxysporum f. sp. phaseoli]